MTLLHHAAAVAPIPDTITTPNATAMQRPGVLAVLFDQGRYPANCVPQQHKHVQRSTNCSIAVQFLVQPSHLKKQ